MNNKLIIIVAIATALILGILLGRLTSDRYYFMSDRPGVVYRCDKLAGDIEYIYHDFYGRATTIKLK